MNAQIPNPNDLLAPEEVAAVLRIKHGTLAVWRCTGRHRLPYVKIGNRIAYLRRDVEDFKLRHRVERDAEG